MSPTQTPCLCRNASGGGDFAQQRIALGVIDIDAAGTPEPTSG